MNFNITSATVLVLVLALAMAALADRPTKILSTAFAAIRSRITLTAAGSGGMPTLPPDVVKYSQVPAEGKYFTADKIPRGLLKEHSTKAGTWGVIRVYKGTLEYQINYEPKAAVFELKAPAWGVIEPTRRHHVKALTGELEFVVEFYRLPGTGPVDEKRD